MTTQRWNTCCWSLGLATSLMVGGTIVSSNCAKAQIAPDATLGAESSVVTPDVVNGLPSDQIDGGAIRGTNLFHSFEQFSIPDGSEAFFNNAPDIQNIISRVTGSSISNIDGLLRANGDANLFLLNPNGIVFGPNASLNIGGSFLGSTASSVNFADGTQFSATAPQTTPLLTISVPIGLQLGGGMGGTAGSIVNRSQVNSVGLKVQPGKTLALLGGNVTLDGGLLQASGGRVELGGLAAAGTVGLQVDGNNLRLSFPNGLERADVSLTNLAYADASGQRGGDVQIQGRRVTLQDGSAIEAYTRGSEPGGTLTVRASDSVELIGRTANGFSSGLANSVFTGATGNGGDLTIETRRLIIQDGAQVQAATAGAGRAGNLVVRATDSVELSGTSAFDSTPSALATTVLSEATGDAGNLTIETGRLIIQGGGQVQAATLGAGQGGTLTINASDSIELSGALPTATEFQGSSGLFVSAEPAPGRDVRDLRVTSNVGDLRVTTGQLTVQNGARISANNFGPAQGGTATLNVRQLIVRDGGLVTAGSFGEGPGGTLTVNASESVEVSGTGTIGSIPVKSTLSTQAEASGNAGNLNITTESLNVLDGAEVTVSSTGSGNAGNLKVLADSIRLEARALLSANTTAGQGNIFLRSGDLVLLSGSNITTDAQVTATGGNITIDTGVIAALEDSDISANAQEGPGGRVRINAQDIFGTEYRNEDTPESDITATSDLGPQFSGVVEINSPDVDPTQGLVVLPAEVVDATGLIATGCPSSVARGESKFMITGRGGLPPNPTQTLTGEALLTDWATLDEPEVENPSSNAPATNPTRESAPTQIVEATGWVVGPKGEVILTASAPTVTHNSAWQTPVSCTEP